MRKLVQLILPLALLGSSAASAQDAVTKGKELFGDMAARHIGPALMSGRVSDLELHPTNDRVIYVGAAGGGVWKSNNGGATFNPIFDEYCQSIGAIAVDPTNPDNTVWVGTGETWTRNSVTIGDGLFKTNDGGSTWQKMGFDKSERIAGIQVNPKNGNEVYVAVLGALWSDSEERGLYKTTDGGKTWNKILYVDKTTGCSDLFIDPKDPNIVYTAFWEFRRAAWNFNSGGANSALYKSTDAGKTWNKIHKGFPTGKLGRIAIAAAPSNTNILYAVIESEQDKDKGLYRSDDGGANWKQTNNDFGLVVRPFYFSRITVDPKNPDVVAKAGLLGSLSRDGGKTFKNLGPMHADIHDIVFDNLNSDRMYVATDGGVYRSWNGGTTMEMVENLPLSQFYHISTDNEEPYNVYGGLQDNGSWFGPSSSPGGVEARDWHVVGVGDGYRVLPHPTKKLLYSEMQGAENVWRYDPVKDQARTIQPLAAKGDPKLRFNWNSPMATSAFKPDRFYMGSQFLHRSEDMGETWVKISPDLTTNDPVKTEQGKSGGLSRDNSGAENHCTIFTIAESPVDENVVWVGTDDGNVQVTKDGGKSWTNVVANIAGLPKNTACWHIEASKFGKGNAYAVFTGYQQGDQKPYLYKTTDFGATWKSIATNDIATFVRNIQEDTENENLLFAGTEFGLYITIDGGTSWLKFTNNVPSVAIHFIDLQKKTNDLVMGTHGRGVIIIDDISPLRQLNTEALAKDLHFFTTKPAIMPESNGFGGTASETQFVGANASSAAKIIYNLKKRHTLGKMTIEIQDANGNKVTELDPGKSKGINIINWNFTTKPPKMAAAKTFAFGGLTSPRIAAGTYKVVIQKGKETYTNDLVVQYDPKSPISLADRKLSQEATRKLFDMSQELAYIVYELDETVKAAENLKTVKPAAAKTVTPLINELNKLKDSMVITKGDNYVGAGEPQLREDMAELYGKIASSFFKPSTSELASVDAIESRFAAAKADFKKIKDKHIAKFTEVQAKNKLEPIILKSFDEFIKSN
jgi:photosystem II stability/assembly factor-like uncharacterized protein